MSRTSRVIRQNDADVGYFRSDNVYEDDDVMSEM